ncbi:MAG: hypothetical protein AABM30_00890 [Actinomycetota bacterium]
MKRSGREDRWAELPPAGTRFALEAAFLILVAAGAAVARLSPLSIIALMLVAWLLVAVIERASSRRQTRALAGVEQTQVLPLPPAEPPAAEIDEPAGESRLRAASRRLFSRRRRAAVEPLADPEGGLEERPSRAHVRRIEAEPPPPVVEAEIVVTEIVVEEIPPPGPAVTKLPFDLPGLDAAPPPAERPIEPPPVELPEEPQPVERAAPPISEPVRARPPAREWNIWDLERRAREQAGDPLRDEEWAALFMHLRQFANADGVLPMQFDDLVRESFSELIRAA